VDLDGDGHDDVISGSYWPGHIFVFRGLGKGAFAAGEALLDAQGETLHAGKPWVSERKPDMDSLAAAPCAVDFDADGDFDLLVGNIAGRVILIRNDGTAQRWAFGSERTAIEAGGRPIDVGGGDAGPSVADWDGDGRFDLIVGSGDGSVWLFRNTGSAQQPVFARGKELLESSDGDLKFGEEPSRPQSRTKVHATDWDGDGRLDLLVGDFASVRGPEPELTDEQKTTRERLETEQRELSQQLSKLYEAAGEGASSDPAASKLSQRMSALHEELRPLQPSWNAHGWVWLYKRRAAASGN
jgi:hypothetical protein